MAIVPAMANTSFLTPNVGALPDPGDRAAQERVEDFFRTLNKALRTHQLYEGSSPVLDRFVSALRQKVITLWAHLPVLTVQVEEREIVWEGATVYQSAERSDNLSFLFYRDGIRELTFLPGFEDEDLLTFLAIMARVHRVRGEEDDLLTLLWELDLANLRYSYVDTLAEGVDPPQKSAAQLTSLSSGSVRADAAAPVQSSVSTDDFEEALYFLDDTELRQLSAQIRQEESRDLWGGVISALFDRLDDGLPDRQRKIISILAELFPTLLGSGNFAKGAVILRELTTLSKMGGNLPGPILNEARAIFAQLGNRKAVEELIRSTEEVPGAAASSDLAEFLAYFPPEALGPLMRGEESATRLEVRKAIAAAIERLASANRDMVVRLLSDTDPVLLAGAARWVGRLGIVGAAPAVTRLLTHNDAPVRLAAIVALQDLRTSTAAGALPRCLEDPDRDVRVAAARALGALRYAPAREVLEAAIRSKTIRDLDITEQIAYFEAFGSLAGDAGVPLLNRILNGRSWLGRRETSEVRACAALGLGKIRKPSAVNALTSAAADADPIVRSAVGRALKPEQP
jgi:HEAT repeat protein